MVSSILRLAMQLTVAEPVELSLGEFQRRVAMWHPVARQARLLDRVAGGVERTARGSFDPKLSAAWDAKRLGGVSYFNYLSAKLEIPTPLGADLYLGYERTSGTWVSPDRRTPLGGLVSAGVRIPVAQRLLVDERKAAIAQSRALRDVAAGERDAMVNKLLATATGAYASWYEANGRVQLAREAVAVAEARLDMLRRRVGQGDAAAIDTLEASVDLQRRRVLLAESRVEQQNAVLLIDAMLWDERGQPVDLAAGARPVSADAGAYDSTQVESWIAAAMRQHPDLRKADAKLREKEVDLAVAQQRLRVPDITAGVAGIAPGGLGAATALDAARSTGDLKLSTSVDVPLLWRKERGKVESSSGLVDNLGLERELTRRSVVLSIAQTANELRALDEMLALQQTIIAQARRLRDGEQQKFAAGESTLFLVTARDRVVIDEEMKGLALQAKRLVAVGKLGVAIGVPLTS